MKRLLLPLLLLLGGTAHAALVTVANYAIAAPNPVSAFAYDESANFVYFIDSGTYTPLPLPPAVTAKINWVQLSTAGVVTVGPSPLVVVSTPNVTGAIPAANAALVDHAGGYAYFSVGYSSAVVYKINLVSTVLASSATYPLVLGRFTCGVLDAANNVAYFGTETSPAQIVKIKLSDLSLVSSITLPSPLAEFHTAAIDTTNHFAYFGSSTTPGGAAKINLNTFSIAAVIQFSNGAGPAVSSFFDTTVGDIWFGTNDFPGRVVRVNLNTFKEVSSLTLNGGEDRLQSAFYDSTKRKAYFGAFASTGVIVQINPVSMHREDALNLGPALAYVNAAAFDSVNDYGYFSTYTRPGHILLIDLIGGAPIITSVDPPEEDVPVGQTASFGIAATGRDLAYQWNRNGAPISGATQTAYQLANTTLNDDSAIFNCTVTNSSGSVTSAGTLLVVEPDVHVYPNPWRADRNSGVPLSFNGLPTGAVVKVFTLAAQFVRSIPESGGIAAWDLKNDAGQNAASGYYFYYVKTLNDRQQLRGKFAIIR